MKRVDRSIDDIKYALNWLEIPYNIFVWNSAYKHSEGDATPLDLLALKVINNNKTFYFVEVMVYPYDYEYGSVAVYQCDTLDGIKPTIQENY